MDFPLQNKVVGSGKLPGYRIRKWGLVEESHHEIRNRSTERKVRDIMYGRSCTLCLFFMPKYAGEAVCGRLSVFTWTTSQNPCLCMKKYWKRMKKLLKKGGEWFTMEASGKKVVRSGTLWGLIESYI